MKGNTMKKSKTMTFTLNPSVIKKLHWLTKNWDSSMSQTIRRLINDAYERANSEPNTKVQD